MLLLRDVAKLAHHTQNSHLGRHLHELEIVDSRLHRGGVGIIGIDNEVVLLRLRQL